MEVRLFVEHLSRLIRLFFVGQLFTSVSKVLGKDYTIKGSPDSNLVYGAIEKRVDMVYRLYYKDKLLKDGDDLPTEIKFYIAKKGKTDKGLVLAWVINIESRNNIKTEDKLKDFVAKKETHVVKELGIERFLDQTEVKFDPPSTVTFSILSMEENDTLYSYRVDAVFTSFETPSEIIKLEQAVKPVIHESNVFRSGKTVKEGESLQIFCKASGKPEPLVKWMKVVQADDEITELQITKAYNEAELRILKASRGKRKGTPMDTGLYRCIAENVAGKDAEDIAIQVAYLEYNTAGHSMVTVKKSNNDELSQSCKISGVPNPTYKWQDPKGAVIETERILSTRINNEADYGNYSCIARSEQAGVNLTFIVEVVKKEGGGSSTDSKATSSSRTKDGKKNSSCRSSAALDMLCLATLLAIVTMIC